MSPNSEDCDFVHYLENLKNTIKNESGYPRRLTPSRQFRVRTGKTEFIEEMELEMAQLSRGHQEFYNDVTVVSTNVKLRNWRVAVAENLSDHNTLKYEISFRKSVEVRRYRAKG